MTTMTKEQIQKCCINCKHCELYNYDNLVFWYESNFKWCKKREVINAWVDETGQSHTIIKRQLCIDERKTGQCGKNAVFFEKGNIFKLILNWIRK